MNGLSNLDEIYKEYSLAPADDLIKFWRSKVKVTLGLRGGQCITSTLGCRSAYLVQFDKAGNTDKEMLMIYRSLARLVPSPETVSRKIQYASRTCTILL